MLVMCNSAAPTFIRVTTWAGLVVPIVTVPKVRLLGSSFTAELDEAIPLVFNKRGFWASIKRTNEQNPTTTEQTRSFMGNPSFGEDIRLLFQKWAECVTKLARELRSGAQRKGVRADNCTDYGSGFLPCQVAIS